MMKIGIIGLGKLGKPVAVCIDHMKHDVMGYDINPKNMQSLTFNEKEADIDGTDDLTFRLRFSRIQYGSMKEVVDHAEIIFLAIQTPHDPKYEGVNKLPEDNKDFDYTHLISCVTELNKLVTQDKIVVLISTVLPGTIEREILPLISSHIKFCYNPFFIAMGTVAKDFMNPEFVLLGTRDRIAADKVKDFYSTIHEKKVIEMDIKSAELSKVAYNTYIGMKIVFINTMMEICHKTGANVDKVSEAICHATDRLISSKYLKAGMGDGGGCHPRDNIAMSWLADKLNLSHDLFRDLMQAREDQTGWLADFICLQMRITGMGCVILGKAFKPETNLTVGSPSILLYNMIYDKSKVSMYDPHIDRCRMDWDKPAIYFIGTKHKDFVDYTFADGSIVIDPWGYMPDKSNVKVIRVGRI